MEADLNQERQSADEASRLRALEGYRIVDTSAEREFDDIVGIAAQICGVPLATITFVDADRQWFKAKIGVEDSETPRDIAFCNYAIRQSETMVVPDATRDPRFAENPLVTGDPNIRFYAGAPLIDADGYALGTLCVLDTEPRDLSDAERGALEALSRQVMSQLELRQALATQRTIDARHRMILDSARDYAIISMDLAGRVTSWSVGAEAILGWSEDEMCGEPCDLFFTPEDRAEAVPAKEMRHALTTGRGTDERWHMRKDGTRFWANGEMMPLTDADDVPIGFLKILRDRTEQHEALKATEEHRNLLTGELQHRVKNTLAIVQAIVSQTLRNAATPQDARAAIDDRLAILGNAHDILTQSSWTKAPIDAVVDGAVRFNGSKRDRVSVQGPELMLKARAALALSMALHELNTNAAKYGALSNDDGVVDLRWSVSGEGDGASFDLEWSESGGPEVRMPERVGFGTRLMTSLSSDLGGEANLDYRPTGVCWKLSSKLSEIEEG